MACELLWEVIVSRRIMKDKHRPSRAAEPHDLAPRYGASDRGRGPRSDPGRRHVDHGRGVWLYGVHPVLAAIANPDRQTFRIVVSAEAETALGPRIAALAQGHAKLPRADIMPREALERLLPRGAVHQ